VLTRLKCVKNNNIYYYNYVFSVMYGNIIWTNLKLCYNSNTHKQVSTCLDYKNILSRGSVVTFCEFVNSLLRAAIQHNVLSVCE